MKEEIDEVAKRLHDGAKQEKWTSDLTFVGSHITPSIKVDDGALTPVCTIATPEGYEKIPHRKARAERLTNLIKAAPDLLDACKIAIEDMEMFLSGEADINDENFIATRDYLQKAVTLATKGSV